MSVQAQKQPFDAATMMKLDRISEPQLSPDGKTIAFTVEIPDVEHNTKPKQIYTVPVAGGPVVKITSEGAANQRPRWTPDSKQIIFISNRAGSNQIWSMNPDGSEPKQITSIVTEADGVLVSPDGKQLVFVSEVYPDCADEGCNKDKLDAENKSLMKARVYTALLYRHWNAFQGARKKHLLTVPIAGGPAKDLTPGPHAAPPFSLGGPEDYAISPDGKELAYVMNMDADAALSTNNDVFTVPLTGGDAKRISTSNGADSGPVYSPDGKWIAFLSMQRAGYESDRNRIALADRSNGAITILNEFYDRSISALAWSPDSTKIFYTSEDRGRSSIQWMPVRGGGSHLAVTGDSHLDDLQFSADGKTLIYTGESAIAPTEIFRASSVGGAPAALTHLNDAVLAQAQLTPLEDFWVESDDKTRVQSFVVKPPDFQVGKKYPVLFLIHGGPQGAWGYSWSFRWNPQVFASAGFVVVMPNPRGSTGYGQKFTDEINSDWGGKPYDDLMAVVDYVAAQPYADPDRFAAAGGSYGGYMVDWILGHSQRFKALVSHAGVYDLRSMVGETEELWFPKWEFQGMPWTNPDLYVKLSPSTYVNEFKTPTLVIHGELDYRVPVGQGMQLFTALQLQKVPSKLLLYPDEGHWILKPQNALFWYKSVLEWITEWTQKKTGAAPADAKPVPVQP